MYFYPPKARFRPLLLFLIATTILVTALVGGLGGYVLWGSLTLSYEITEDSVTVFFGPKVTRIERESITDVYVIERPTRGRRHIGTGFPGLYEGCWSFAETGPITLFSTSIRTLTVIETAQRKWGVSPADPDGFVQTIMSGGIGRFPAEPSPNTRGFAVLLGVVLLITVVPLGFILFYLNRLMKGIGYELTDHELRIHGGLRPVCIPYDAINHVEVRNPKGFPWKSFGISGPGLHWGSFSWKDAGPRLKLYATRLRPLVTLSTDKGTVGISPEDPERFIAAIESRLPQRPS